MEHNEEITVTLEAIKLMSEQYTNGYTTIPSMKYTINFLKAANDVLPSNAPQQLVDAMQHPDKFRANAVITMLSKKMFSEEGMSENDFHEFVDSTIRQYLDMIFSERSPSMFSELSFFDSAIRNLTDFMHDELEEE